MAGMYQSFTLGVFAASYHQQFFPIVYGVAGSVRKSFHCILVILAPILCSASSLMHTEDQSWPNKCHSFPMFLCSVSDLCHFGRYLHLYKIIYRSMTEWELIFAWSKSLSLNRHKAAATSTLLASADGSHCWQLLKYSPPTPSSSSEVTQ